MSKLTTRWSSLGLLAKRVLIMIPLLGISKSLVMIKREQGIEPKQLPERALDFYEILILAGSEGFPDRLC